MYDHLWCIYMALANPKNVQMWGPEVPRQGFQINGGPRLVDLKQEQTERPAKHHAGNLCPKSPSPRSGQGDLQYSPVRHYLKVFSSELYRFKCYLRTKCCRKGLLCRNRAFPSIDFKCYLCTKCCRKGLLCQNHAFPSIDSSVTSLPNVAGRGCFAEIVHSLL